MIRSSKSSSVFSLGPAWATQDFKKSENIHKEMDRKGCLGSSYSKDIAEVKFKGSCRQRTKKERLGMVVKEE